MAAPCARSVWWGPHLSNTWRSLRTSACHRGSCERAGGAQALVEVVGVPRHLGGEQRHHLGRGLRAHRARRRRAAPARAAGAPRPSRPPPALGDAPLASVSPSPRSTSRAASNAVVGGGSSRASPAASGVPQRASCSANPARSAWASSGESSRSRCACSASDQHRYTAPGASRPARPARWVADGLRREHGDERVEPARVVGPRAPREARVDDDPHPGHRQAGLGDRRSTAPPAGVRRRAGQHRVLVRRVLPAVQRETSASVPTRRRATSSISRRPGRNTSASPGRLRQRPPHHGADVVDQRPLDPHPLRRRDRLRRRAPDDLDGVQRVGRGDHRARRGRRTARRRPRSRRWRARAGRGAGCARRRRRPARGRCRGGARGTRRGPRRRPRRAPGRAAAARRAGPSSPPRRARPSRRAARPGSRSRPAARPAPRRATPSAPRPPARPRAAARRRAPAR